VIINLPNEHRAKFAAIGINTGAVPEKGLDQGTFGVDIRTLHSNLLNAFYELLKPQPGKPDEFRSIRSQINSWKNAQSNPTGGKIASASALCAGMIDYIVSGAIEGWVFKISNNPIPALVTGLKYYPPVKKRGEEQEAYIEMDLIQNVKGTVSRSRHTLSAGKIHGCTADEALRKMGWQKETEELHQIYQEQLTRYKELRPCYGEQLVLRAEHSAEVADGEEATGYGFRRRRTKKINLMQDGGGRLVHNDPMSETKVTVSTYRSSDPDNPYIDPSLAAVIEAAKLGEGAFSRAPWQLNLNVYHLAQHIELTVHVQDVELYKYDEGMRAKLVLPEMYAEVLDVLTHDLEVPAEDIVEGKSGGNFILLAGPPGLAKTLTAEVYAEFRKKPLLKIHSGQLGTTAQAIEQKLLGFYKLAQAWDCPVLLDEFDVFGRARGNDLEQNAVVAVFLRTLEYQDNTMFLTTNRADTMDDAILSRMMAIIKFDYPTYDVLRRIWLVLRDQFLPKLTDDQIDELMEFWKVEKKKMSGRDVKNILKLAARYAAAGRPVTTDLLKVCAGFRGV
jgi:hypothetical protein